MCLKKHVWSLKKLILMIQETPRQTLSWTELFVTANVWSVTFEQWSGIIFPGFPSQTVFVARLRKKEQNYFTENFGEKCEENQSSLQN